MRKLIFVFLSLFIFSAITLPEPSLAATHHKQKKVYVKSSKKKAVKQKKKVKVKSSHHTKKKYAKKNVLKVRYSHHINKPQEGDLLKLEGMVKDLNEQ
ncbi:MAG: hypothetical protein GU346_05280 [Thermocrinis sp.]|jgi:hypothetical protein|nr:hypothetical protein [Thermocrinis sp.]